MGGGIYCIGNTSVVIRRCLFYNNSGAMWGGAIYIDSNSMVPTIENCTISFNVSGSGAGIFLYDCYPVIRNTIISDNINGCGIQFYDCDEGTADVEYCNIYGNEEGPFQGNIPNRLGELTSVNINGDSCDIFHNIFEPPLFINQQWGNYGLLQNSPCIDAGDPASQFDPDSTIADIGKYYFDQNPPLESIVNLTPITTPIVIPQTGGSFNFNIDVVNNDSVTHIFDVWTIIRLPGGGTYGPIINIADITLNAGSSVNRSRIQNVPPAAPPGLYFYNAYVGEYPNVILAEDYFIFKKTAWVDK